MRINGPLPTLPRLRGREVVLISYVRPTLKQSLAVLQHTLFEIKKKKDFLPYGLDGMME